MKEKKSRCETMPFPRFTKVIINHFLSQYKSLSKLKFQHYHTIKDDGIVSRLKFVKIGEDYQEYRLHIPDMMLNVDVSDESEPEPTKKKVSSRSTRGVVIQDTPSAPKPKLASSKLKLKGVQSLTPKAQEAADTMHALKESKKTSRRQSSTGGSSEGTGRIPGVPDEFTVISTTSSEGTGTKPGVLDEEKKKDNDGNTDDKDEDDDHISDIQDTDNEDAETESDEDEIYKNDEMTDAAKADVEKTTEEKGDDELARNAMTSDYQVKVSIELPLPYSSLSVSFGFAISPPYVTPTISIVQQTTTPIPTPPITTEAPSINTTVPESDALSAVQLRVSKLEKDMSQLNKIDHYAELLLLSNPKFQWLLNNILDQKLNLRRVLQRFARLRRNKLRSKRCQSIQLSLLIRRHSKSMNETKSFNINPANHALYHALMEALIEDENAMDKGVADTVNHYKRPHDDDKDDNKDPSAIPNQEEPIKEPIVGVVMDDLETNADEDVVNDVDRPQDDVAPKTNKTSKYTWFKQPLRPPTLDPEWNKRTCTSSIELEYNIEECFKALTDRLDWNNPEGDRCPFDLTKPLPLKGRLGHLTIVVEYFFNNDLEFLKSFDLEKKYTTPIMKTKAARYEIVGTGHMVPTLWSPTKVGYDKDALKEIKHWGDKRQLWKRADRQLYKFKEGDFVDLHLNDIEDMLLLIDLQLGVESYQKKLNITEPQKTFPEIKFKELYTPSYKPPVVIYEDLNKQTLVMQADELYKFSDRTVKTVRDELHHRILDFLLGYNKEMSRRKWTATDKMRLELMVELIDKQMRKRRIIQNLERLVGAQELEIDYKLMTRNRQVQSQILSCE
ncbi:hypothetical protein Tco_1213583 [Tanacetum coccineum]